MARPWALRGWRLAILVTLAILGVLLWSVQDDETLLVESPVAATDSRFAEYVASLVGAPVEPGDAYEVLRNGDEVFPAMLDAIARAERRVNFESFIYEDGEIGDRFTEAFIAAARRGVDVRIVLDGFGSRLKRDTQDRLRDAGVQVAWFNELRPWRPRQANYRTHRKVLAVDGRLAFTGGVGVADHWLGHAQSPDHWRDTQFEVTGPAVRNLEAAFYENWIKAGGRSAPALDERRPPQGTGAQSVVLWSTPKGGASRVKLLYLLSIAAARQTVDIQSPYFVLDPSTRWVLDEARARGVRVRILTDGDVTDAGPVKDASRHEYQDLLDRGYEIYEYQPTMMHVKATMVDGVWSVIGSANFDNRSFELNDELTVGVQDVPLARELTAHFEDDLRRSTRLESETWRARPIWTKAREWFWSHFGELF